MYRKIRFYENSEWCAVILEEFLVGFSRILIGMNEIWKGFGDFKRNFNRIKMELNEIW